MLCGDDDSDESEDSQRIDARLDSHFATGAQTICMIGMSRPAVPAHHSEID